MHNYTQLKYQCRLCGKEFRYGYQVGGHLRTCPNNPDRRQRLVRQLRRLHSSSAVEKRIETVLKNKTFVGPKNPMWKGGPGTGYESGWRRARQQVWDRDKVCQVCLKPPLKTRRLDVHHIVRRRDGGTNDLSNLIGVHHVCHIKLENGKV